MCGPLQTFSHGGAKYFVTFIDAFSRKICGHNLNGEVLEAYKTMVELQTGKQIEMLRIDNGTCLIGVFFGFFLDSDIVHQTIISYTLNKMVQRSIKLAP